MGSNNIEKMQSLCELKVIIVPSFIILIIFILYYYYIIILSQEAYIENQTHLSHKRSEDKQIQILLLSYSRSGSSLLGTLLSLHPSTAYFYEPFKKIELINSQCQYRFDSSEVSDLIEETLGGIFKCDDTVLKKIKKSPKCKKTNITVIKTIRIHLNGLLTWLHKFPLLKIVHLVRDPRFQAQSRLLWPRYFKCESGNLTGYCQGYKGNYLKRSS